MGYGGDYTMLKIQIFFVRRYSQVGLMTNMALDLLLTIFLNLINKKLFKLYQLLGFFFTRLSPNFIGHYTFIFMMDVNLTLLDPASEISE